jgi:hypothetical protein
MKQLRGHAASSLQKAGKNGTVGKLQTVALLATFLTQTRNR